MKRTALQRHTPLKPRVVAPGVSGEDISRPGWVGWRRKSMLRGAKKGSVIARQKALQRRATVPRAKLERELKSLCRKLVVEIRDRNTCQRCGKTSAQSKIDWAHVKNRGAKSLVWMPWASLALCAGCHFWFDGEHRQDARAWWAGRWPERALKLESWQTQRNRKAIDREADRLYLLQELALKAGHEPGIDRPPGTP